MENEQDEEAVEVFESPYVALRPKIDLQQFIGKTVFWIGTICALIALFAYIIIVTVMVVGFNGSTNWTADIVFAAVNAAVGIVISQFLKIQGIAFAKSEPDNKVWLDRWVTRRTKDRKYKNMNYYWRKTLLSDILMRGIGIALLTIGVTYIFIEASNDAMKILMAVFNIVMFVGFGLVSMASAYNWVREEHVEWIKVQIEQRYIDEERRAAEKAAEVKRQSDKQFVDALHDVVLQYGIQIVREPVSDPDPAPTEPATEYSTDTENREGGNNE